MMIKNKYNRKQIEEWAAIAVKDCLSMTDTLSQYIKENDKTPSWDGDVIIYKQNSLNKKDIVGKITVQVKGHLVHDIEKEKCSFPAEMADLINYKNTGGTIYFVVLIDEKNITKRRIFYETLTPVKINYYIKGHERRESRTIKFKRLPEDKYRIQTIFLNFYHNSSEQHSFSNIPPISVDELSSRSDILRVCLKIFELKYWLSIV